jgi:hypothetical protein
MSAQTNSVRQMSPYRREMQRRSSNAYYEKNKQVIQERTRNRVTSKAMWKCDWCSKTILSKSMHAHLESTRHLDTRHRLMTREGLVPGYELSLRARREEADRAKWQMRS